MNKIVVAIGVILIGAVALLFVYQLQTSRLTPAQLEEEAQAMARLKKAEEAEKAKSQPNTEESADKTAQAKDSESKDTAPPADSGQPLTFTELKEPPTNEQGGVPDKFVVKFECSNGDFYVEFNREWAPNGVKRVYELVLEKFFDECRFFRYAQDQFGKPFVVQWGISGDPSVMSQWRDKNIKDDPVKQKNVRGMVTFAAGRMPNSRSTQLFVSFKDNTFLDPMGFAPVGKVIQGLDVAEAINSEYGEKADQGMLQDRGNAYLKENFPNMDYIKRAVFVQAAAKEPSAGGEPAQQKDAATPAAK